MFDHAQVQAKSRLGRLLVEKGMITPVQLDFALNEQVKSGRKLGEILMEQGWISSRQLKRALRKQTNYRTAAAFAALIMGPIAPLASFAAPVGVQQSQQATPPQSATQPLQPATFSTLTVHYRSPAQPLMASNMSLSLPGQTLLQYDNLCLRAPEAMCS
ncbi:MAG TPA: hypothetical protein VFM46_00175 [Pseudomonadales bacterium]|nr:hypothetical protein [Pseudomonadales bacterium]